MALPVLWGGSIILRVWLQALLLNFLLDSFPALLGFLKSCGKLWSLFQLRPFLPIPATIHGIPVGDSRLQVSGQFIMFFFCLCKTPVRFLRRLSFWAIPPEE